MLSIRVEYGWWPVLAWRRWRFRRRHMAILASQLRELVLPLAADLVTDSRSHARFALHEGVIQPTEHLHGSDYEGLGMSVQKLFLLLHEKDGEPLGLRLTVEEAASKAWEALLIALEYPGRPTTAQNWNITLPVPEGGSTRFEVSHGNGDAREIVIRPGQ